MELIRTESPIKIPLWSTEASFGKSTLNAAASVKISVAILFGFFVMTPLKTKRMVRIKGEEEEM
jgi:hypothetical protein